jgi:hypothetical protein
MSIKASLNKLESCFVVSTPDGSALVLDNRQPEEPMCSVRRLNFTFLACAALLAAPAPAQA